MPFSLAARACQDHDTRPSGAPEARFYAADLLPAMQGLLAAVADSEAQYETEREQIEQGSGSEEVKQCSLAALEAAHQHRRALHEQWWGELQGQAERR
jgi:hypothetical protein